MANEITTKTDEEMMTEINDMIESFAEDGVELMLERRANWYRISEDNYGDWKTRKSGTLAEVHAYLSSWWERA